MSIASVLIYHPIAEFAPAEYLSFDETSRTWSIEQLTCTDKVKRALNAKKYKCTALPFIAEKISHEPGVSLADLNTIHRLWQKKYPAVRNPLKKGKYTLLDPGNPNLPGNIQSEWLKVKNTFLCLKEAKEGDEFDFEASLPLSLLDENVCKNLINITLDGLCALKGRSIVLVLPGAVELNIFAVSIRTAIRTIEKYVYKNADYFDKIVISFSQNDVNFLAKAIEVCREMEHPYAHFFESKPEPEPEPEMRSASPASLVRCWTQSGLIDEWTKNVQPQTAETPTNHRRCQTDYGSLSDWHSRSGSI